MTTNTKNKGFTLVELMVVVAIIGILASIAVPNFNQYSLRTYIAMTRADARNAHTAVHGWLAQNSEADPPAEVIGPGPATGVRYPEARASDGTTIDIAAGGTVTATHSKLKGCYIIDITSGAVTDTLEP